ncbi:MFS transporter [Rhodococcus sp. WMMA185]|uniref:MFS transporter n=1 Tax=Rhodococcus sp. WMMA185 TaxID=679318 RepID=UPI0008785E15|nr:MFS transporter [Rhodococcus sp. WMMA185]AOW93079.1 MFS transporter [Rhodococcus sp. WMMA185]
MVTERTEVSESLRRARAATFTLFWTCGFLFGMWVVHIPAIETRTGIDHATLGTLLLMLGLGAICGMKLSVPLADRVGSGRTAIIAGLVLSITTVGPGLATGAWQLGLALMVFGFTNGALNVSMNSHAVEVERRYGRPIMAAFHALFSVGGVAGALLGALTLAAGWAPVTAFLAAGVIGIVAVTAISRWVVHDPARPSDESATPEKSQRRLSRGRMPTRVLVLGGLAFALMLSEGVANDWSALQVKEHLGTSDAVAALAFGAFSVTMTVGRFTADRVSGAFGPVAVIRYGMLVAATGILLVLVSGLLPLTILGWALYGLGLSGAVPQIFTAAGNQGSGSTNANLSRVVLFGYLGFLSGPAIMGWISQVIPLTTAMAVPLMCALVVAACAGVARPQRPPATETPPATEVAARF